MSARILVVEDNPLNLRLVCDILEHRGHALAIATNVAEGRAQLARFSPELILMDVQLPGGGGELLLRELRAMPALASIPVLALTAQAMDGDEARLLAAGFTGYLSKPIDTRTFSANIEAHLPDPKELKT